MALTDLTGIALIAGIAALCGVLFHSLRQPPLVGYILAGVVVGPSALGLVHDRAAIELLAELGVLMLLFLIGLELSLRGFKRVWQVSIAAAALQVAGSLFVAWAAGHLFYWSPGLALLLGFSLALSSTAVAIKILEDIGELRTDVGRIAVGVLIAQDLSVVPMLLIATMLGSPDHSSLLTAGIKVGAAVAVLAAVILMLSGRRKFHLPFAAKIAESTELSAITAIAICFVAATASGVIGLSPAYGAFLAGLVVGNTADRPKMIAATQPIQSALLMVFFLSIGLLLDLSYLWHHLAVVVGVVLLVTVGKTVFNIAILRLVGEPWPRAFLAGTVMGQVGEFSFVLAAAGMSSGQMGESEYRMLVSVIALSLAISPFWLFTARRLETIGWRSGVGVNFVLNRLYGSEWRATASALRKSAAVARTGAVTTAKATRGAGVLALAALRVASERLRPAPMAAVHPGADDAAAPPRDPAPANPDTEVNR